MPSPSDYRRASGYRHSTSAGVVYAPTRMGHNSGPKADWSYDANPLNGSFVFEDLADPRLASFLSGGRASAAGVVVGERMALRNSTFYRAINLIASAIGMLPIHLMRKLSDGDTEEATDHPLYRVLKSKPNAYQTALEFKSYMQTTALLDGNAYALVVRDFTGKVIALNPLRRGSVTPLLADDFTLTFRYSKAGGGEAILKPQDIFHFRSMISCDGVRGLALLDVATQALGIAVQAERAAGRLFANGMMAGGSLQTDKTLGDDAIARLRDSLDERFSGTDNAAKWMILEEGLKMTPSTASPKDSQHLETREHQDEELSRFTGVPRPLLMLDETSWGSGVEVLGQFFVTYCLGAWFVAWEQAIERCLAPPELDVLFPRFNAGALLRGSLKDQASFFASALGAGGSQPWMAANEVRKAFDQNNIAGGDGLPPRAGSKPSGSASDPTDPAPPKDQPNG